MKTGRPARLVYAIFTATPRHFHGNHTFTLHTTAADRGIIQAQWAVPLIWPQPGVAGNGGLLSAKAGYNERQTFILPGPAQRG